jgi:multidrug efflux system membrane fusion protein
LGLLLSLAVFTACSNQGAGTSEKKDSIIIPVAVSSAVEKTVPIQLNAIGNVQAYSTVTVKAQVGGELIRVHFQEGQDVRQGDPLFTIDPRPFKSELRQAEANLKKDAIQADNARKDTKRYADLLKEGLVTQQQYDQIHANAEALKAAVRADQAAVENARLQLAYTSIRSPINGRTGNLMVHAGNLVKANDTSPLVTINQTSPIYVAFSVPQQNLPEIKKFMTAGKVKVEAIIPNSDGPPSQGILSFIDNTVDPATGTILLKAIFPNKDKTLWPGQFANVVLTLTLQSNAIVVPSQAVQSGQQGQYLFIVKPDLTVESRPVVVGREVDQEAIIEKGVQPGEKVVTDGQIRLSPGAKVQIKSSPSATASAEGRP